MWVYSRDGFFSIVKSEHCGPGELSVRARAREDLVRFLRRIGRAAEADSRIKAFERNDYPFRLHLPRELVSAYLDAEAMDIGYSNFRAASANVSAHPGRASALQHIWTATLNLWK